MLTLFILAALSQADAGTVLTVDAGTSVSNPLAGLYGSCPTTEFADGGTAELSFPAERLGPLLHPLPADAGATSDWYVPYPRPQRSSCRLAACEERVRELDTWGRGLSLPWWAAASIAISAAALAAWGTWELCSRVPVLCGGR